MLGPLSFMGVFLLGGAAGALVTLAKYKHVIAECRRATALCRQSLSASANGDAANSLDSGERFALKALVVSRDPLIDAIFSKLFRELRIEALHCTRQSEASDHLACEKFAAIVLDLHVPSNYSALLRDLPGPNKRALLIAVTNENHAKEALDNIQAGLVVQRPLVPAQIRALLHGMYGRMLRDEQAYFRLPIEISVWIRTTFGKLFDCKTLNLSQKGMAVCTQGTLENGERIDISFSLPNTDILVSAKGSVIWDDKHGKAGISFECSNPSVQERYFEWLQDHFFKSLESQNLQVGASEQTVHA